jgi:hypothetical protein
VERLKAGRENVLDSTRSGRPSTVPRTEVKNQIDHHNGDNTRIRIYETESEMSVSRGKQWYKNGFEPNTKRFILMISGNIRAI